MKKCLAAMVALAALATPVPSLADVATAAKAVRQRPTGFNSMLRPNQQRNAKMRTPTMRQ